MVASAIKLTNLSMVVQVSGTPGTSNSQSPAEWSGLAAWSSATAYVVGNAVTDVGVGYICILTRSATATHPASDATHWTALAQIGTYAQPSAVNDTRLWDAFAADLGFAWDAGDGSVLCAFGDTLGENWKGGGTTVGGGHTAGTWNSGNVADMSTSTPASITITSGAATVDVAPNVLAVKCTGGQFGYVKFTGHTGTTVLTGCTWLGGTGAGPWAMANGNAIDAVDSQWAGLTNRVDTGWRSQTLARSTDTNLSNGPTFSDMRPLHTTAKTAQQLITSAHDASVSTDVFTTAVTYTNTHTNSGTAVVTIDATTHGLVVGQWFTITGDSALPAGTYEVYQVTDANHFTCVSLAATATGSGGTLKKAANANIARPSLNKESSKIPTGGVAVNGVGVAGATRQYLFYQSVVYFSATTDTPAGVAGVWWTSYLGVAYSDDVGLTWTNASSDTTIGASSNGQNANALTGNNLYVATLPGLTSGGVEVDTSTGTATLSYTNTSASGGNHLTGVTWVAGATGTVSTGGGARFNMIANDTNYCGLHQQGWPWRPGDNYIYLMTTVNGRYGLQGSSARMVRIPEATVTDVSSWRYFTGFSAGVPQWSTDRTAATDIFPDPFLVGEPSYYFHPGTGLYVTSYLETVANFAGVNGIVLRTAPNPWGPWSDRTTVVLSSAFGMSDLYGGMIHPWSNVSTGAVPTGPGGSVTTSISSGSQSQADFYFHISLFAPYATYLMKATLSVPSGMFALAR